MAITFTPQKSTSQKRGGKYISVLMVILLFIFITVFVWLRFLKYQPVPEDPKIIFPELKEIKIDFEVLKNPIFQILEDLPEIIPPEEIGRENPFMPY